jgi:Uma2 family endonuclease
MPVTEATYRQVALEDHEGQWELVCGRLRRKPPMTTEHDGSGRELHRRLVLQLDPRLYAVGQNSGKVRTSAGSYYIPDISVIPRAYERRLRERPGTFEVYDEPLPLVVEVWSPSTGDYDVEEKLAEYRRRGDLEIWRLHPYERTLTAWRRQPDGSYAESLYQGGIVRPHSLPGVSIDLATLFDLPV